jgi:hypothetical protein
VATTSAGLSLASLKQPRRGAAVLSLVLASACGGAAGSDLSERDGALHTATPDGQRGIDADTRVTLERTECFGPCPVYTLSISGDGTVTYWGERFVRVVGEASSQLPVADVEALVDAMLDANYLALRIPTSCREFITDASTVTTSLTWGGRSNTIEHYYGNPCAPAVLRELEDRIDAVAGSAAWLACDAPDGVCYER